MYAVFHSIVKCLVKKYTVCATLCGLLLTPSLVHAAPSTNMLQQQIKRLEHELGNIYIELENLDHKVLAQDDSIGSLLEHLPKDLKNQKISLHKNLSTFEKEVATLKSEQKEMNNKISRIEKRFNESLSALQSFSSDLKKLQSSIAQQESQHALLQDLVQTIVQTVSNDPMGAEQHQVYIVQPGDTLGGIALKHKSSIKALKKVNQLNSDMISIGQKLIIP